MVKKTFDSNLPEITNIFKILRDKCSVKYDIDWAGVIQNSIKNTNSNNINTNNINTILNNDFNRKIMN